MFLKQIYFYNFRNIENKTLIFNPFLTIIIGKNSLGKTNILEGIHVVLQGEGFRERKEEELVNLEKESGYVEGIFSEKDEKFIYRVAILKKKDAVEKRFFINKTKKRHFEYFQDQIKAVLFSPEQIEIIIGSPSIRREYFDKLLSFYDYEYKSKLDNYESALRKRNKILERHFEENKLKEELEFWNTYLIQQGKYISEKRRKYIQYLNLHQKLDSKKFFIEYLENQFSQERLNKYFAEERRWGKTLIGPQKDDFQIYLKNKKEKNIHRYGSRSEQRMAIFWLKINEIFYHEEIKKKKPILLLDDIFSELDLYNKKIIFDLVKKYQTIVTTTEDEIVALVEVPHSVIRL